MLDKTFEILIAFSIVAPILCGLAAWYAKGKKELRALEAKEAAEKAEASEAGEEGKD